MERDASTPIRVLVWIPPGLQRTIVTAALEEEENIFVYDDVAPRRERHAAEARGRLREILTRLGPDVVVLPIPCEEIPHVVAELGEIFAIFVSTDGRSAITYDGDVSAESLVRMIQLVATRRSTD